MDGSEATNPLQAITLLGAHPRHTVPNFVH
jgi:hypothetical protein